MSEQEQLAQILENCELWIFDPETAKVFANTICGTYSDLLVNPYLGSHRNRGEGMC